MIKPQLLGILLGINIGSRPTGPLVLQEKNAKQIFLRQKFRFAKNVQCTLNIGIE